MRIAISAVAAVSGLVLLALAFYGQPALYLHEAREEWTSLTGGSSSDQSFELDREDPAAERIAQLQQQVTALKKELAAEPAPLAATEPPKPAAPTEPSKVTAAPVQPLREAARSEPRPGAPPAAEGVSSPIALVERPSAAQPLPGVSKTEPGISASPKSDTMVLDLAEADALKPGPAVSQPPKVETVRVEPPNVETPKAAPRGSEPPKTETATLAPSGAEPARAEPARETAGRPEPSRTDLSKAGAVRPDSRRADSAKADPARSDTARADAPKGGPSKPEALPSDAAGAETARPGQPKLAALKPAPAPPPLAQPLPPRQETEDAQSVLARLRQLGPTAPRQAGPPPPSTKTAPIASPLLPRLAAARAALADGRIEDARRLLQETQLQLVFRPIDAAGEDSPRAGRSAADVAHSLEALSANNIPLSRRFIDRAADDLSERGGDASFQAPDLRATGYAPAYPPH